MAIRVPSRTQLGKYGYVAGRTMACPTLSSPENSASLTTSDTATLQWSAVTGAKYYYVYLWPSSDSEPDEPTITTTRTYYVATNLQAGTEYSWRIIAASPFVEASGCGLRSFTTLGNPACPVLTFPDNGAPLDDPTQVTLTWAASLTAVSYKVYVWIDGDTQPATPTATTTDTFYLATGLVANTDYRWLIDAVNIVGDSVGCGSRIFTTANVPPLCPVISAPADGGVLAATDTVTLSWTAANTATSYNIYLWESSGSEPGAPTYTTSSTSYNVTGLTQDTQYSWKVTAINDAGESSGCASYTFTTLADVFGALVYNTTTNVVPTFHWNSESYDLNDWHSTSSSTQSLTVVSGVTLVRVAFGITAAGSASDIGTYVYKDGAAFYGMPSGGFRGSIFAQGSASSAPIVVSEGQAFTQLGTLDAYNGQTSWFSIEKLDPATKYALVYKTTNVAFGNMQQQTLSWEAEVADTDGFWSASDPQKLVVPSGVSLVQLRANSSHSGAGNQLVGYIFKTGTTFPGYAQHHQNSTQKDSLPMVTAVVEVSVGDYFVNAIFREDSGTLLANNETWFSIEEIPSTYKRVLAYKTANQSFSGGVEQTVTFQTEVYDTDSMFDSASSQTDFVVPAGVTKAKVCYNIGTPSNASVFQSRVYLNDTRVAGLPQCTTDTTSTDWMNADGAWVEVSPGDVFTLKMQASSAVTLASNQATWMCILCQ